MFEIRPDLAPALMPIAWMIGRWEGTGKGQWPGEGEFEYGQVVEFTENGGDYLHYLSQTFVADADGRPVAPLSMETGFWRPQADRSLEVVMCHPEGWSEVWFGTVEGAKIELVTDAVARTVTAPGYTGGQRLYGQVEGDLLWTFDRSTTEHELQPYMWARLKRTAV
ncbi:FABP family protein [Raineyella sp. LH-20]|uniref:FABP family protein n=1 Tax=Raineyella sp. LH-20 TaxID=3081204 RepID=UPI002954C8A1|nr:FABP family protein [Raineyella sp. LH-20]WOP17295.1 FABP family protein [Raineyella sp. LH-20]